MTQRSAQKTWDVIVIGGGHAGTEAAHACARMGVQTALLTLDPEKIGLMSCNPAMGGLAKGQLIKEIDALGGVMGRITDLSAIQYRQLNSSKGPAVRSSRAQCDKPLYALNMQRFLGSVPNLTILQAEMTGLIVEQNRIRGIELRDGSRVFASAVIITSGTFLRAVMHRGEKQEEGGRVGDPSSNFLSDELKNLGFRLRRLKTGTPPRLHKDSIDWQKTEEQPGDEEPRAFSFYYRPDPFPFLPQIHCHITYTNSQTHEIIEENIKRSPMYSGAITGAGPRYCPSIEDKVVRFRDKERHQIFLEPEGLNVDEVYVNGVSTSLPDDVQQDFIRSVPGLENAQFIRYGYAVEYDSIDARQLGATLESKDIGGLFFAGQVNGTSGYEEAGAQGLVAGINAARAIQKKEPVIFSRSEGYLGVLIDDLILKGSDEPYRMFTSRAEYRLLLREDNADLRLSENSYKIGLLGEKEFEMFEKKSQTVKHWRERLKGVFVVPSKSSNEWMEKRGFGMLKDRVSGEDLLKRPKVKWRDLQELGVFPDQDLDLAISEQLEIQLQYEGYIKRDLETLRGVQKNEGMKIPVNLDYEEIAGLSNEVRGKLTAVRPETIGQASRIQGVTPAAVANLMIYLKMKTGKRSPSASQAKKVRNQLRKERFRAISTQKSNVPRETSPISGV